MLHTSLVAVLLALELVSQTPGKTSWVTVDSKAGGFSVSMPGKPLEQTLTMPSPIGNVKVKMYICPVDDSVLIMQEMVLPKPVSSNIEAELQAAKNAASQQLPKLISEKRIKAGDMPGIEYVNRGPMKPDQRNRTVKTHTFMKGSMGYNMMVVSGPDKPLPAESDKFFDSIRFGGKPADVTAMAPKGEPAAASKPKPKPAPPAKRKPLAKIDLVDRTPEDALRTFLMAMIVADETTLRAVTLPNPDFDWLLRGEAPPFKGLRELKLEMRRLPIERLKFGDQVTLPGNKVHVIRATEVGRDRAALLAEGHPTHTLLRKVNDHWKVDATPIIAARKAADAARQQAEGN